MGGSCTGHHVAGMWIPLSARLTPADVADNQIAPLADRGVAPRGALRFGRYSLQRPERARQMREDASGFWSPPNAVATRTPTQGWRLGGSSTNCVAWPTRTSTSISRAIFEVHEQVPTKGRVNTARFALGAVLVYQLALLYRHERKSEVNRGLKPFLRAA